MTQTENKNIPISHIQKLIGIRMLKSKRTKPCFYLELNADVTYMMKFRSQLRKRIGQKVTTNTFYLHAIGNAAAKFPLVLANIAVNRVKIPDSVNLGFAVNAPQGLVVPVIGGIDRMTIKEIAAKETELIAKARSNQLRYDDLQSENIAMSNLGPYGIDSFIGIVPPHVTTILTIGNVDRRVCVKDGRAEVCRKVNITLAADHSVVNGVYAAKFLSLVKQFLEAPEGLVEENA
ncbi:MAG: 2-oxo acid dehydrogenase subunit E2 [Planctomycetes bacterium]|nr:2-oxo acid dehydrogenase subunit E2 [Planctomycetota bacterium]